MERDDLIKDHEYAVSAYHDEEHGKKTRKNIWKVTLILSILTIVEVFMGATVARGDTTMWIMVKYAFIIMTLVKAAYIVLSFMHLGDERKNMRNVILIPYIFFILYMIALIIFGESTFVNKMMGPL